MHALLLSSIIAVAALLSGCGSYTQSDEQYHRGLENRIDMTGTAFMNEGVIPIECTCQGGNQSPGIYYANSVPGAVSYALTMTGPLPAGTNQTDSTNLLVYNLPPAVDRLPARLTAASARQLGAALGRSGQEQQAYWGPCPPPGRQRYLFRVYALNTFLPTDPPLNRAGLLAAMQGHILAYGELRGYVYASRKQP